MKSLALLAVAWPAATEKVVPAQLVRQVRSSLPPRFNVEWSRACGRDSCRVSPRGRRTMSSTACLTVGIHAFRQPLHCLEEGEWHLVPALPLVVHPLDEGVGEGATEGRHGVRLGRRWGEEIAPVGRHLFCDSTESQSLFGDVGTVEGLRQLRHKGGPAVSRIGADHSMHVSHRFEHCLHIITVQVPLYSSLRLRRPLVSSSREEWMMVAALA